MRNPFLFPTALEGADEERAMAEDCDQNDEKQNAGDGIDRRGFLECMAWAGTGLLWSIVGGVPSARLFAQPAEGGAKKPGRVEDAPQEKQSRPELSLPRIRRLQPAPLPHAENSVAQAQEMARSDLPP